MEFMETKIKNEGQILEGNVLLVDKFLNQQLDIELLEQMALAWKEKFKGEKITKIVTIEASGIAIAAITAKVFGVPALFAKKKASLNLDAKSYKAEVYSFTKKQSYTIAISQKLLNENDRVFLVDDFLANGCAMEGLIKLVQEAGATIAGIGIAIEKSYQEGRKRLEEYNIPISSAARIQSMDASTQSIEFLNEE